MLTLALGRAATRACAVSMEGRRSLPTNGNNGRWTYQNAHHVEPTRTVESRIDEGTTPGRSRRPFNYSAIVAILSRVVVLSVPNASAPARAQLDSGQVPTSKAGISQGFIVTAVWWPSRLIVCAQRVVWTMGINQGQMSSWRMGAMAMRRKRRRWVYKGDCTSPSLRIYM